MSSVTRAALDQRLAMARRCSHEGVVAGAKAAVVATVAAAIPTVSLLFSTSSSTVFGHRSMNSASYIVVG
ncbi:hypothetical protein C4D60_Mb01t05620 [Musa balbisiana]|uniref:Uncharacterized protein n=1 Tax=Musa balbisiana TaxID=52838 RepID=A0A4S8JMI7_MUSBA|nr:hypothetical protein C4D60_Mb01t05620 [Musa balbisiana]